MSIEPVKHTSFLVERGEIDRLIEGLARSRTVHVVELVEEPDSALADDVTLTDAAAADASAAESKAQQLTRALEILDTFVPPRRRLYENFVTLPAEMRRNEYDRAVSDTDTDALCERAAELSRRHTGATKRVAELVERIRRLEPWSDAEAPPSGVRSCGADLGTVPAKTLSGLCAAADELDAFSVEAVGTAKPDALVAAVWLNEAGPAAAELLARFGFVSLDLDPGSGPIGDQVKALRKELAAAEAEVKKLTGEGEELSEQRRVVLAVRAHWEAEAARCHASTMTLASKRIVLLSGYVRVREMDKLEALLAREFPTVSLIARDPQPDENIPVSLGGSKFFAPAQSLTSMFGLPDYFGFDPSPFIFIVFTVFFGFCFGDVVYGLGLLVICWRLAHKAADHPSLAKMLRLFAWCGGSAMVFGALTGSWCSDLFSAKYIGSGFIASALIGVRQSLAVTDLMSKPMIGLSMAVGIGVITQFYGIVLRMYREARKGDYVAVVCDGGLWLIYLPSLLLVVAGSAGAFPAAVTRVAGAAAILSAVALVLTQGRHEESFLAKAITGVVSLYGILGTYGTTSFLSDTLSYSRLLALGLSTAVIGMAANFLANLAGSIPWVGFVFLLLILVAGHMFNFLVGMLGGFVHSVRLIFLEFFTRFYEGGATPFAALGEPGTVRVISDD